MRSDCDTGPLPRRKFASIQVSSTDVVPLTQMGRFVLVQESYVHSRTDGIGRDGKLPRERSSENETGIPFPSRQFLEVVLLSRHYFGNEKAFQSSPAFFGERKTVPSQSPVSSPAFCCRKYDSIYICGLYPVLQICI